MIIEIKKWGDKMETNYGITLLEFRAKHLLTQKQLANILGVDINTVYRTENKKTEPSKRNKIKPKGEEEKWLEFSYQAIFK